MIIKTNQRSDYFNCEMLKSDMKPNTNIVACLLYELNSISFNSDNSKIPTEALPI